MLAEWTSPRTEKSRHTNMFVRTGVGAFLGWETCWNAFRVIASRKRWDLITIKATMFEEQLSRTATFGCPVPVEVIWPSVFRLSPAVVAGMCWPRLSRLQPTICHSRLEWLLHGANSWKCPRSTRPCSIGGLRIVLFLKCSHPSSSFLPSTHMLGLSLTTPTTAASAIPVAKIATKDLQAMAPDIMKLLEASLFDLEAVDSMMLNMKSNSVTREQAACDWLKGNTDRWNSWIPKATKCNPGFGVYDDVTDTFTAERATATTCRACLPGMFSKALGEGAFWARRPMTETPKKSKKNGTFMLHGKSCGDTGVGSNTSRVGAIDNYFPGSVRRFILNWLSRADMGWLTWESCSDCVVKPENIAAMVEASMWILWYEVFWEFYNLRVSMSAICNCYYVPSVWSNSRLKPTGWRNQRSPWILSSSESHVSHCRPLQMTMAAHTFVKLVLRANSSLEPVQWIVMLVLRAQRKQTNLPRSAHHVLQVGISQNTDHFVL